MTVSLPLGGGSRLQTGPRSAILLVPSRAWSRLSLATPSIGKDVGGITDRHGAIRRLSTSLGCSKARPAYGRRARGLACSGHARVFGATSALGYCDVASATAQRNEPRAWCFCLSHAHRAFVRVCEESSIHLKVGCLQEVVHTPRDLPTI